jgi:hypothetical protein
MADETQMLHDKRALDEMVYKCMHAMDTHEWPLYRAQLTDDAEFDFTDHGVATEEAADVMRGADNYLAVLRSVIEGFDATQHCISNMFHDVTGDSAKTQCYVLAEHFLNNSRGGRRITCGARYHIDAVRMVEGWRIKRLKFLTFWFDGNTSLYQLAAQAVARRAA